MLALLVSLIAPGFAAAADAGYWADLLRALDNARISTIHAFCASLLRSRAVEAGLDPQFVVLEQAQADTLLSEAVDDEVRRLISERDETSLQLTVQFGLDGLRAMVPKYEFLKEIRQRGMMVGIEFGPPKSFMLKSAWTVMHTLDKSLFPQAAIIPLLDKHHIITQVAGHAIDVVKLLPPLVINEEDVNWFLTAFEDVMVGMHKFPGPAWDVLTGIGKMALTQRAR